MSRRLLSPCTFFIYRAPFACETHSCSQSAQNASKSCSEKSRLPLAQSPSRFRASHHSPHGQEKRAKQAYREHLSRVLQHVTDFKYTSFFLTLPPSPFSPYLTSSPPLLASPCFVVQAITAGRSTRASGKTSHALQSSPRPPSPATSPESACVASWCPSTFTPSIAHKSQFSIETLSLAHPHLLLVLTVGGRRGGVPGAAGPREGQAAQLPARPDRRAPQAHRRAYPCPPGQGGVPS